MFEGRFAMGTGLQRVATGFGWLLCGAVVITLLGIIVLFTAPRFLGVQGIVVLSGSMEPDFSAGDIVFIEPVKDGADVQVGDVITFSPRPQVLMTHRVIERIESEEGLQFRTKATRTTWQTWVLLA